MSSQTTNLDAISFSMNDGIGALTNHGSNRHLLVRFVLVSTTIPLSFFGFALSFSVSFSFSFAVTVSLSFPYCSLSVDGPLSSPLSLPAFSPAARHTT